MMPRLQGQASLRVCMVILMVAIRITMVPSLGVATANELTSEAREPFRVAFSESMFSDVNTNDAKASAKAWGQQVAEEMGVSIILETRIESDLTVIRDALLDKELEMVAVTSQEFLVLERDVPVGPVLIGEQGGKSTQEFVLLVSADGPIGTLADLRDKTLISHVDAMTCFALPWLEVLLRQELQIAPSSLLGSLDTSMELSSSVLPVFFGKADACLVTRVGYETMTELNPQVGRALRVLAASPPVVPMVVFVRGGYKPELRDKAVSAMLRVDQSASGRQLLTLFRSSGLSLAEDGAFDTARSLMAGQLPPVVAATLSGDLKGTN